MIRSKLRYKVFPSQNKTVTANKVIDTYRAPSPFIFFSTTDNVEFDISERVTLVNGVKTTMDALSMVKNAAEVGFAGYLGKLELYFGSSSPETINFVTEVINIMYKSLTSDFSQLTFFNITKPKIIYNKAWFNQFSGAGKNPIAKATGGACGEEIIGSDRGIGAPRFDQSKLPSPSSEKMAFVHDKASKKWIEQQKGVTVNIAWTFVMSSENIVNAISREVARGALALDVELSEIKRNKNSKGAFSIDNFLELVNPDNWGAFIVFFTDPLQEDNLDDITRAFGENHKSPRRTINKPI